MKSRYEQLLIDQALETATVLLEELARQDYDNNQLVALSSLLLKQILRLP